MSWGDAVAELERLHHDNPEAFAAQVTLWSDYADRQRAEAAESTSGLFFCVRLGCPAFKADNNHRECLSCHSECVRRREEARAARERRRLTVEWIKETKRLIRESERPEIEARREARRRPARKTYSGPPRPGFVYRLYDGSGLLLYVGKTYHVGRRLFTGASSHAHTKEWWPEVARVDVAAYATESDAMVAEAWAIKDEDPVHNIDRPRPGADRPECVHRYTGSLV